MADSAPIGGDPLSYGDKPWLAHNGVGGKNSTGDNDNVALGRLNDLGIDDHSFPDLATIIQLSEGENNAAFAALNGGGNPPVAVGDKAIGGVGVFGQSIAGGIDEDATSPPVVRPPMTRGIGVAGHCNTGCGVYGQSLYGAGVVGFISATGWGSKASGLHPTFRNAGVFGHNEKVLVETPPDPISGAGVRGHGDALRVISDDSQPRPSNDLPGGVFSSGQLEYKPDPTTKQHSAVFSRSSQAQMRLVPHKPGFVIIDGKKVPSTFPEHGAVGDFFMTFDVTDGQHASLFLCVDLDNIPVPPKPIWVKVQMSMDPNDRHHGGEPMPYRRPAQPQGIHLVGWL